VSASLMVLAKATTIIVFPALIAGSLAVRPEKRRNHLLWTSTLAVALGLLTLFTFVYGYGKDGLYFSTTRTLQYLSLLNLDLPLAVLLFGLVSLLATPWLAATNVCWVRGEIARSVMSFAGALALGAILATSLLGHGGQSQIYFLVTAASLLLPLSAWGMCIAAPAIVALTWRLRGVSVIIFLATILVWVFCLPSRPLVGLASGTALSILLGFVSLKSQLGSRSVGRRIWATSAATMSATFVVATGVLNFGGVAMPDFPKATIDSGDANSISSQQILAIRQLGLLNPNFDLVASNFLCDEPQGVPPECMDIQFPVAALAGQRMLVEGSGYSTSEKNDAQAKELRALQHSFATSPDQATHSRLWDQGVRWFFVDRRRTTLTNWKPYAEILVANPDAFVLRLESPRPPKELLTN